MRVRTNICVLRTASFFACLLALIPQAVAAPSITLNTITQAPGGTVSVTGSGFGATKIVAIGFGAETTISNEIVNIFVNGTTRDANFTHRPVKPGSVGIRAVRISDGYEESIDDKGNGELWYYDGRGFWATLNYASGSYHREGGTSNVADWTYYASYKSCQYNVTSFGSITTTSSGTFTANFTVPPGAANGLHNVTAIDAVGNVAVTTLNVDNTLPEALPFGVMILLSATAVAASSLHFRKRPRITV